MCMEDLCVCPGVTQEGIRDAMDRRKRALSGR
jgi:bacterioferritin-associated ferredoxin